MMLPLIFGLGGPEVLLIVLVVLLLFGGRKIPELMRGLGRGVKSFKDGVNGVEDAAKSTPTAPRVEIAEAETAGKE